jgi:16S rRNA (guanine527-N7)-methyltransferase
VTTADAPRGEAAPPATVVVSPPPAAMAAWFGPRSDLAQAFAEHLGTSAVERGLLGPREVPRLWSRHILNCVAVAPLLPPAADVVDVGSGAGLPGLVLAIAREDVSVTLAEPLLRRVAWLEEVRSDLGLTNVSVVRARAEELRRGWADVATARAVAPLAKLSAWCLPLVRPGGVLLAIKGRSAADELRATADELPALGAVAWEVLEVGGDLLEEPTTVVEVRKGEVDAGGRGSRREAGRARR